MSGSDSGSEFESEFGSEAGSGSESSPGRSPDRSLDRGQGDFGSESEGLFPHPIPDRSPGGSVSGP